MYSNNYNVIVETVGILPTITLNWYIDSKINVFCMVHDFYLNTWILRQKEYSLFHVVECFLPWTQDRAICDNWTFTHHSGFIIEVYIVYSRLVV